MPAAVASRTIFGEQQPRISSAPPRISSAGREAIALARHAGLILLPWQEYVLDVALGERGDGLWSAFEIALIIARQNGKGGVLEALELAHLFLFGSRTIIHSAHRQDTALDAQGRLWALISQTPDLLVQVRNGKSNIGNGKEGITLRSGAKIRFQTRVKDGGRGLSGDLVVLDEAMDLPPAVVRALLPTMRARPNPQLWYVGSPVDQDKDVDGATLADVRRRGIAGNDPSLVLLEWSAGEWAEYVAGLVDLDDRGRWATGNPSLGYLIDEEHMAKERRALRAVPRSFVIDLLGIGDWPAEKADEESRVIALDLWESREDPTSVIVGRLSLAIDMDPAQTKVAICAAGSNAAGKLHVESVEYRPGTDWVPDRVVELVLDWDPDAVVIDEKSPANALIPAIEAAGIEVTRSNTATMQQACGVFLAHVTSGSLVHIGQDELTAAVQSADARDIGEQWGWARKGKAGVQPLVAVTLAAHNHLTAGQPAPPPAPPLLDVPAGQVPSSAPYAGAADLMTAGF